MISALAVGMRPPACGAVRCRRLRLAITLLLLAAYAVAYGHTPTRYVSAGRIDHLLYSPRCAAAPGRGVVGPPALAIASFRWARANLISGIRRVAVGWLVGASLDKLPAGDRLSDGAHTVFVDAPQ